MSGSLTHSPADVIRYLLIDLSLGTLPSASGDWPIIANRELDSPDNLITVFDTAGLRNGRVADGEVQEHEGFQIRVRAGTQTVGQAKINAIKQAIDNSVLNKSVVIGASTYIVYAISRRSGPFYLGQDVETSKRIVFTINAVVALRQTI